MPHTTSPHLPDTTRPIRVPPPQRPRRPHPPRNGWAAAAADGNRYGVPRIQAGVTEYRLARRLWFGAPTPLRLTVVGTAGAGAVAGGGYIMKEWVLDESGEEAP